MTRAAASNAAPLIDLKLASETRLLADTVDLVGALDFGEGGFAWLRDGVGFIANGVTARIAVGAGHDRFGSASREVSALLANAAEDDQVNLPGTGVIAVGALPFGLLPGELIIPRVVIGCGGDGTCWITRTAVDRLPPDQPASIATATENEPSEFRVEAHPDRDAWEKAVDRALDEIAHGRVSKVVLARQVLVQADRPIPIHALLNRLRQGHPSCFTFAYDQFVGASPELLVRRTGNQVVSGPTAGTVSRGATTEDDDALASALINSAKDSTEHRIVVDAVVESLAPWCTSIDAAQHPEVVRLATVSHLTTTVRGTLREPAPSALELVGALHPTPAVGGMPRSAALKLIAELEPFDRELYAGPVGWVDAHGDGEWAVALRCAHIDGARARLFTGAGIVAGSDPSAEWAETQSKLEPMLQAILRP